MALAFRVALELRTVVINFAQVSGAVALSFIVEMRRGGMAALAAGGHGAGSHFVAKFDHRDEAVAAGANSFPSPRPAPIC